MTTPKRTITPRELYELTTWTKKQDLVLSFTYNGKVRVGEVNYCTDELVNILLIEDGECVFSPGDEHQYKSFLLDKIQGTIEVYTPAL